MLFIVEIKDWKTIKWWKQIAKYVEKCKDWMYTIELKRWWKRSLLQNSYYWAICSMVAKELWEIKDDVDLMFREMFLKKVIRSSILKKQIEVIQSSSDLTTVEMTEYINTIIIRCSSKSIYIPPANECFI